MGKSDGLVGSRLDIPDIPERVGRVRRRERDVLVISTTVYNGG